MKIYFFPLESVNDKSPRVIDEARARKLANDLKRCSYYETCATYGLNVEAVFQDGKISSLSIFCAGCSFCLQNKSKSPT